MPEFNMCYSGSPMQRIEYGLRCEPHAGGPQVEKLPNAHQLHELGLFRGLERRVDADGAAGGVGVHGKDRQNGGEREGREMWVGG